jgi:hypothetical protein
MVTSILIYLWPYGIYWWPYGIYWWPYGRALGVTIFGAQKTLNFLYPRSQKSEAHSLPSNEALSSALPKPRRAPPIPRVHSSYVGTSFTYCCITSYLKT